MTKTWGVATGLLVLVAAAVGGPAPAEAQQWCYGAYQSGAGTNFSGSCPPAPPKAPLYKRLGGREGIAIVVADFVGIMVEDPRVNARFKTLKPPEV